jgi:very-short-patch-repair endonuclease
MLAPVADTEDVTMDVAKIVRARGGIVPSARLIADGVKGHFIEKAVAAGALLRIRRRWIAVPDADPLLLGAAGAGVVISCVTQAKRLGLWVLEDGNPHFAARPHAGRVAAPAGTTIHWAKPLIGRNPDSLEDPIENVLAAVVLCQPYEAALAVVESAIRKGKVDPLALRRFPLLPARARHLLDVAQPFSDSGLETFVVPRLRWMKLPIVAQPWIAGHHVDFLIGERLILQIDGAHHVGAQRTSDNEHDAQLLLLGYHVIRVGFDQVVNHWPSVQHLIMRAVAQGLHRAH